jgi:hypothetical protein
MKTAFFLVLAAVLAVVVATPVSACVPVIEYINEYVWESGSPVSFCLAPNRNVRAFLAGGQEVQAQLRFPVIIWSDWPDLTTAPVEWRIGGAVELCGSATQIVPRDGNGWVTVLPNLRGGGHSGPGEASLVTLWINVCPNQQLDLDDGIYFNSPDVNGDLRVDLTDISYFATDFFGAYDYRSDFNWDGEVDLGDLTIMAQGVGTSCD